MAQQVSSRDRLVSQLMKNDFEFRQLSKEHASLEESLNEMGRKKFLTREEELKRKQLQKMKLQGKDRMESILRARSESETVSA